jgi:GTP-binding protein EngB required for normal cell division
MKPKPLLLIIGNSNVGKSSITRLLMPNPRKFKGKIGKSPGSTLMIKKNTQNNLPYEIVDLPGFGYVSHSSRRRGEHIKKQIVIHIEKHHNDYFFGLIVINILRIEDEISKHYIQNENAIPLSFELIQFLSEFNIPLLVVFNKIDKISNLDKDKLIQLFVKTAKDYGLSLVHLNNYENEKTLQKPFLEFSALKKTNLSTLKKTIQNYLMKK